MPGVILNVMVTVGQSVKEGDVLLILEAMKMENEMTSPSTGTVKEVAVSKGSNVNTGDLMVVIE
jgi:biotin carboxyl carrier protein